MDGPHGDDVRAAVDAVASTLAPAARATEQWDARAGILKWSCRETLAHVVDCLTWYASLLSRLATADVEAPEVNPARPPRVMVDSLRSMGAVLATVIDAAPDDARAWHPYGVADRSGVAGMACDEVLVHGADLAAGLGLPYSPPTEACQRTLHRLFPWAPTDGDPWVTLQWANGRAPLGERPPETKWLWQCAPLAEWDGGIRRR